MQFVGANVRQRKFGGDVLRQHAECARHADLADTDDGHFVDGGGGGSRFADFVHELRFEGHFGWWCAEYMK